jgi:hypothetical protein
MCVPGQEQKKQQPRMRARPGIKAERKASFFFFFFGTRKKGGVERDIWH